MLKHKQERGQAYVEFVVVLPGLLLLTLLIWEFAYFWWAREVTATATFEGARQVAVGQSAARGYQVYDEVMRTGLGRLSQEHEGYYSIAMRPAYRTVQAQANVPYQWPTGLGALMGGGLKLDLKSSAFFRLEAFYPGPPDTFE
jgi:Flp pilus assembly protein TadG